MSVKLSRRGVLHWPFILTSSVDGEVTLALELWRFLSLKPEVPLLRPHPLSVAPPGTQEFQGPANSRNCEGTDARRGTYSKVGLNAVTWVAWMTRIQSAF
ncbi:hypothetical protein QR685DRAFT_567579 [Neurospora intermedia]|uniref:Uncharacterized protein n=1 Tax=Neurospora intermedia TaxID=5142 RepID=A0ABR3DS42_NEUIN